MKTRLYAKPAVKGVNVGWTSYTLGQRLLFTGPSANQSLENAYGIRPHTISTNDRPPLLHRVQPSLHPDCVPHTTSWLMVHFAALSFGPVLGSNPSRSEVLQGVKG